MTAKLSSTAVWRLRRYAGLLAIAWAISFAALAAVAHGDEPPATSKNKKPAKGEVKTDNDTGPRDFTSRNFLVHTDLPAAEAADLLKRLETMLDLVSRYWGRPPRGVIECFVVKDTSKWDRTKFDPAAWAKFEDRSGITISHVLSSGDRFLAKATVYSTSDGGVAQHEAVHAYCHQAFGSAGPTWYAEGMAEMGQYWRDGEKAVVADPNVIKYLTTSEPKQLTEIVATNQVTGDSWRNYAWRWALCHLLANNENYASRFRPLGLGLLMNQEVSFEQVYGPMAGEISFEYLFFLKHMNTGYRVDLCSWDWKRKFRPMAANSSAVISAKVLAARGWQGTGLTLAAGTEYEYAASGTWQVEKEGKSLTADGDESGSGRLEGILLKEFELSEPFELGVSGKLTAPGDGKLYLRCRDDWCELADNKGQLTVKLKLSGVGKPLVSAPADR